LASFMAGCRLDCRTERAVGNNEGEGKLAISDLMIWTAGEFIWNGQHLLSKFAHVAGKYIVIVQGRKIC